MHDIYLIIIFNSYIGHIHFPQLSLHYLIALLRAAAKFALMSKKKKLSMIRFALNLFLFPHPKSLN